MPSGTSCTTNLVPGLTHTACGEEKDQWLVQVLEATQKPCHHLSRRTSRGFGFRSTGEANPLLPVGKRHTSNRSPSCAGRLESVVSEQSHIVRHPPFLNKGLISGSQPRGSCYESIPAACPRKEVLLSGGNNFGRKDESRDPLGSLDYALDDGLVAGSQFQSVAEMHGTKAVGNVTALTPCGSKSPAKPS